MGEVKKKWGWSGKSGGGQERGWGGQEKEGEVRKECMKSPMYICSRKMAQGECKMAQGDRKVA